MSTSAVSFDALDAARRRSPAADQDLTPKIRNSPARPTFLLRIAHNRALSFIAKRGRPVDDLDDLDDHADRVVATTGKNPALADERKERESRLLAAVRALPVPHRQVITLLLEGLSHQGIAAVLGTTENNIAVRANRARAAMRVLIEEGASS